LLAIPSAQLLCSTPLRPDRSTAAQAVPSAHPDLPARLRMMENRTSFVIAHRLSTVRRADAIIVLERGVVREVGRHDELLARPNGLYARLYSLQMFENGAVAPGGTPGAVPGAEPAAAATPHASTSLP